MAYKRILLKLSGELFAGSKDYGIDPDFVHKLAQELKDLVESTKVEVAIYLGTFGLFFTLFSNI